jgi:tRNA 2-thiouridine synthesizing protein A
VAAAILLETARMARMLKFSAHQMENALDIDKELDVRGLNCPLPILRAKKALGDLSPGQVLKVMATDPGSVKDFAAFCRQTGHELVSSDATPAEFTFLLRKH